jgi:hypothetical protein
VTGATVIDWYGMAKGSVGKGRHGQVPKNRMIRTSARALERQADPLDDTRRHGAGLREQAILIDRQATTATHDLPARDPNGIDHSTVARPHQMARRMPQRDHFRPVGIDQHHVGLITDGQRPDLPAQTRRPRTAQRQHFEHLLGRDQRGRAARIAQEPGHHRALLPHVVTVAAIGAEQEIDPARNHFGMKPTWPRTIAAAHRGTGTEHHIGARPRQRIDFVTVDMDHVHQRKMIAQHTDPVEPFDRAAPVSGAIEFRVRRVRAHMRGKTEPAFARHRARRLPQLGRIGGMPDQQRPCAQQASFPAWRSRSAAIVAIALSVSAP